MLFNKAIALIALCRVFSSAERAEPSLRRVTYKFAGEVAHEGQGGGSVRRSIGSSLLRSFDPFLLLDHFHGSSGAGVSDHPHRGFETVSYLLTGGVLHEDFTGHKGKLRAGDTQWMTAGRGVVHAEVCDVDGTEGIQLWVDLKKKDKMALPRYQELKNSDIPKVSAPGVNVTVIAGESLGVHSPTLTYTPAMYLDLIFSPNSNFTQPISINWNAFVYGLSGELIVDGKTLKKYDFAVLSTKESAVLISSKSGGRGLIIGGEPTDEPIVQHGPFVMNTEQEIREAFQDYKFARNGFESAAKWKSEIQYLIKE